MHARHSAGGFSLEWKNHTFWFVLAASFTATTCCFECVLEFRWAWIVFPIDNVRWRKAIVLFPTIGWALDYPGKVQTMWHCIERIKKSEVQHCVLTTLVPEHIAAGQIQSLSLKICCNAAHDWEKLDINRALLWFYMMISLFFVGITNRPVKPVEELQTSPVKAVST